MDIEQEIRRMAASGFSKAEMARTLSVSREKLNTICSAIPKLKWKGSIKEHKRRSVEVFPKLRANLVKARAARNVGLTQTVRGVSGTVKDLWAHFNVSISYSSVIRRVDEGMSLEDALFTPCQNKARVNKNSSKVKSKPLVEYGYVRGAAGLSHEHRA